MTKHGLDAPLALTDGEWLPDGCGVLRWVGEDENPLENKAVESSGVPVETWDNVIERPPGGAQTPSIPGALPTTKESTR